MINYKIDLETIVSNNNGIYDELLHKVPYYRIDIDADDKTKLSDILIKVCVIIPIVGLHVFVEVERVDNKGQMHFNAFGVTSEFESGDRNIFLSEILISGDSIVNIEKIMMLYDSSNYIETSSYSDKTNPTILNDICTSLLNYYFCNRFYIGDESTHLGFL